MVNALKLAGFEGADALRKRKSLLFLSAPGGHHGYEDWHRVMDEDMVNFIMRKRNVLNERMLLAEIRRYYSSPELVWRFPDMWKRAW